MKSRRKIIFDAYIVDTVNELLWMGSERIHLRPKTFAFLEYLALRPARLVTKDELLKAVWQNCNVGDEALKHCMAEIRRALNDKAEAPKFIETVHRRGYRFLAKSRRLPHKTGKAAADLQNQNQKPETVKSLLVGRTNELAQLQRCLEQAKQGERQTALIYGEQGIGKTSLVDAFLDRAAQEPVAQSRSLARPWIARGQCIRSHGAGEAYMPVFEALTELCRGPGRRSILATLRRFAPLWLVQMPSLISPAQLQSLQRTTLGATRERMLREMAEALEALTAKTPLILVLEDLHWSDFSTLDLISYWTQRRAPAKLLLIGTYRPADAMDDDHPLKAVKAELQARQQCQELPLPFLDEATLGEYLARRFPGHRFPAEMTSWIRRMTGGNPLFMLSMLDDLEARGLIARRNSQWTLNSTPDEELSLPPTIQQIIRRQIERCAPQEQQLLQAGSIEGVEFSVNGVAVVLGENADRIDARCRKLAERNQFLQPAAVRHVEERRRFNRYRFINDLYQSIFYELIPGELRAQMHLRFAEHAEATYGTKREELAARLAMHFDRGCEPGRAMLYYQQAAENANSRYAGREALALATRGLQLLETVPSSPERAERELCLQIALGNALMSARGLGAQEVSRAFGRARELVQQMSENQGSGKGALLFSALYGLWNYHWVRAEYAAARELAEHLLLLAEAERDSLRLSQAHHSLGLVMMDHGEFAGAFEHLNQAEDIASRCCAAVTKWHLGYPDQALKDVEATLEYALQTRNPEHCIFAYQGAARVHMARRENKKALDRAQAALDLALHHGLGDYWVAPMKSIRGWALAGLGQENSGFEQARQALAVFQAIGAANLLPLLSVMFAEASLQAGEIDKGLAVLDEALAVSRRTGMLHCDAEICRLKGELWLRQTNGPKPSQRNDRQFTEAESCFRQALEVARSQGAKSLELRAAISLARLLQERERRTEARECLAPIYKWFTEGHKTADLREALKLLEQLT